MKDFKAALTKIKSKIGEKLPDGNDVWGYHGISRELIFDTIDQIYTIATEIGNDAGANRFEVIYLKRQASSINDAINKILDSETPEKYFNEFLNELAELLWAVKHTFFVINKNGLHADEEIIELKEQAKKLQVLSAEIENRKVLYENAFSKFQEDIDAVSNFQKEIATSQTEIAIKEKDVKEKHQTISNIYGDIEGWDVEIDEKRQSFVSLEKNIKTLSDNAKNLEDALIATQAAAAATEKELANLKTQNKTLLDEAQDTLGMTNRVGMSASFKERKDELNTSLKIWGEVFVLTVIGLAGLAYFLLINRMNENISFAMILTRFTIAAPLVWLAWFSAKQYLSISRIKEDYAFKFAATMAYEGHKKATRELEDKELEKALLVMSLCNMEENPIRLYSKEQQASPITEIVSHVKKARFNINAKNGAANVDIETKDE